MTVSNTPQQLAWRGLFFVGLAPAILIFFVRRMVQEPEVYTRSKAALAASGHLQQLSRGPLALRCSDQHDHQLDR